MFADSPSIEADKPEALREKHGLSVFKLFGFLADCSLESRTMPQCLTVRSTIAVWKEQTALKTPLQCRALEGQFPRSGLELGPVV